LVHTRDKGEECPPPGGHQGFLDIGRVIGLHGVRGKIKVAAFSGDPSGVLAAKALRLSGGRPTPAGNALPGVPRGSKNGGHGTAPGTAGDYEVVTAQRAGGCAVFSLKGIDSIEAAEPLVKAVVSVRREALPTPPEGEFYWVDAVGCLVVDESGAPLGEVVAVEPGSAYDFLVVRRPGGEDGYLPVVEAFLRKVDTAARRVVASPPEGW
jgi:16S rRNA processing protein RimM